MLENLQPVPRTQRGCAYTKLRKSLEPADQVLLDGYMADENWSTYGLAKAMRERGLDVTYMVLYRHRTKQCKCEAISNA